MQQPNLRIPTDKQFKCPCGRLVHRSRTFMIKRENVVAWAGMKFPMTVMIEVCVQCKKLAGDR